MNKRYLNELFSKGTKGPNGYTDSLLPPEEQTDPETDDIVDLLLPEGVTRPKKKIKKEDDFFYPTQMGPANINVGLPPKPKDKQ